MTANSGDLNTLLLEQQDVHWTHQLGPRLEGLTDEEHLWSGAFGIDFAYPTPVPGPVTTIAWRLGHVIVGCSRPSRADRPRGLTPQSHAV